MALPPEITTGTRPAGASAALLMTLSLTPRPNRRPRRRPPRRRGEEPRAEYRRFLRRPFRRATTSVSRRRYLNLSPRRAGGPARGHGREAEPVPRTRDGRASRARRPRGGWSGRARRPS